MIQSCKCCFLTQERKEIKLNHSHRPISLLNLWGKFRFARGTCINMVRRYRKTRQERHKLASYPRLKNSKSTSKCQVFFYSIQKTQKLDRIGGRGLWDFATFLSQNIKQRRCPLRKKFENKFSQSRKNFFVCIRGKQRKTRYCMLRGKQRKTFLVHFSRQNGSI